MNTLSSRNCFFQQSNEISAVKQKNEDIEEEKGKMKSELDRMNSELEKMKKSSCKLEKEHDVKMKEMKNEMQNAFDKVNEYMQENEKLQEEVRVLNELRKVNEILMSKITSSGIEMNKENDNIEDNEELNESVEVIDDYPDDEEVANSLTVGDLLLTKSFGCKQSHMYMFYKLLSLFKVICCKKRRHMV